jgi:hypothetical protein
VEAQRRSHMAKLHPEFGFRCPVCRSPQVSRSEFWGIVERAIFWLAGICPLRCETCGRRFYLFPPRATFYRQKSAE